MNSTIVIQWIFSCLCTLIQFIFKVQTVLAYWFKFTKKSCSVVLSKTWTNWLVYGFSASLCLSSSLGERQACWCIFGCLCFHRWVQHHLDQGLPHRELPPLTHPGLKVRPRVTSQIRTHFIFQSRNMVTDWTCIGQNFFSYSCCKIRRKLPSPCLWFWVTLLWSCWLKTIFITIPIENDIFTAPAFVKPVLYPSFDSWDAESSGECFYFILYL